MKKVLDLLYAGPQGGNSWVRFSSLIAGMFVGCLFILAAVPKILDPLSFAKIIFHYNVLPEFLVNLVAIYLPWLEFVCGVVIILIPRWRVATGLLIAGMLLVFTLGMGSVLARELDITCGCFSTSSAGEAISLINIVRNIGLLACVALVVWAHSGKRIQSAKPDSKE